MKKHPVWKQAAEEAMAKFKPGDLIPWSWIHEHLEIDEPEEAITVAEHKARVFETLGKVEGFKDTMLTEHRRFLVSVRGAGYQIIPPAEQASTAVDRARNAVQKAAVDGSKVIRHIDAQQLSLQDARRAADALGALAWLAQLAERDIISSSSQDRLT